MQASSEIVPLSYPRVEVLVWLALATISLTIVALIIAAPVAAAQGHPGFASTIYQAFSYLCHQIPERSLHLANHPFAVCSRCTGLYAGLAFAALGYPLVRPLKETEPPRIVWLILAAMPLAIDFSLGYFGIWQNNHFTRFTTGALLGGAIAFFIVPGAIDLGLRIARKLSQKSDFPSSARDKAAPRLRG